MIRKLVIRRFKRFEEETFEFSGHVAGPNNTGKTTVLQAIAAWKLAFNRWRSLNDFKKHAPRCENGDDGQYVKAPLARQAFYVMP
jgi:AAA15 family ATPase/GTPase